MASASSSAAKANEVANEEVDTDTLGLQLPLSRIRKICRCDPDATSVSLDALKVITFATEKFIKLLSLAAYEYAQEEGRKTIQMRDIDSCVKDDWLFAMLEDAISDWPGDIAEQTEDQENVDPAMSTGEEHMDAGTSNPPEETLASSPNRLPEREETMRAMSVEENSGAGEGIRDIEDL